MLYWTKHLFFERRNSLCQKFQKTGRVVEYAFNKAYDVTKDVNFISRFENADVYGDFVDETLASAIMATIQEQKKDEI